jgi:glycosyltransferase involved in cell wall biosynthesis
MIRENKISVVIPTYNSQKYIIRALDSVINQSRSPDEIIISDDGSKDNTLQVIKNWIKNNKKISIKILESNHTGPGAARNIGIKNASHCWISFLDSDDTWEYDKIKLVKEIILEEQQLNFITHLEYHKSISGVQSLISYRLKELITKKKIFSLEKELYLSNLFSTSAVTIKKELLFRFGFFDEKLYNAQDYDLWLNLSKKINLKVILKPLSTYYSRNDSITSRPFSKRIICELIICFRYKNNVPLFLFIFKLLKILFSKRWVKQKN